MMFFAEGYLPTRILTPACESALKNQSLVLPAAAGPNFGLRESKKSATRREVLGSREVAGGPSNLRDSRKVPKIALG